MDHAKKIEMTEEHEGQSVPNAATQGGPLAAPTRWIDSGWIYDENNSSHTTTIPNELGTLPMGMQIWFSPSAGQGAAYPVQFRWFSSVTSMNPHSVHVTDTQFHLQIWSGNSLFSTWVPNAWTIHRTGYWRIIYWG